MFIFSEKLPTPNHITCIIGIEDVYSESIVKKIHPELTYVNISELKELTPDNIALEASKLDFNILQTNV